jgi:hypothetical protein
MAHPYQSKHVVSNNGVHFTDWLVIAAFLITIALGYGYYRIYKSAHQPIPDQPVASSAANSTRHNL